SGRYSGAGKGTIRLKGKMAGADFVREIPVDFSSSQSQHDVLSTLWARTRVDDLMSQDFRGAQQGAMKDEVKQAVIQLGLDYRLMTQFTSFVAVEEMIVTDGGQPRRIDVPVEVPEGVNREAVFGQGRQIENLPINSRSLSSFSLMAPGSVAAAQTVTVTRSGSDAAKAKPAARNGGASAAGTGPGQAGNTGGRTQSSANTIHGAPPAPKSTPSSGPTGL